ncbi:hypothetical protein HPB47_003807, partial [Ixodes persulcatus]
KYSFNLDWTNPDMSTNASWIRPVLNDSDSARCTICCKKFTLSNMGKMAITTHVEGKKHQAATKSLQSVSQTPIVSLFKTAANVDLPSATATGVFRSVKTSVGGFLLKNEVIKAEIMWCLNTIITHDFFRPAAASAVLFPLMFPTCETARKTQLGKDKVGYTICRGIGPYFQEKFL